MSVRVGELSEAKLLARILPRLRPAEVATVGPGDDAAVLSVSDGSVVISIDTLVENLDFKLSRANGHETSGFDVGWKAAAQNLSDINAMGARPTSLLVSLTLPPQTCAMWVEDLADGIGAALTELGAEQGGVAGGDLGGGGDLSVTIAATGTLDARLPVLRSGARPGDVVAIAGTVGRAAAGFALMESSYRPDELDVEMLDLVDAQRRPRPPLDAGPAAAAAGATAMLDLSDGLLRDANRIATASGVLINLDARVVSTLSDTLRTAAGLLRTDPEEWVLTGGEDYGILATFPADRELPPGFGIIGTVLDGNGVSVDSKRCSTLGWDHFAG